MCKEKAAKEDNGQVSPQSCIGYYLGFLFMVKLWKPGNVWSS